MHRIILETAIQRTKEEGGKWYLKYSRKQDMQIYIDLMDGMISNTKQNIVW